MLQEILEGIFLLMKPETILKVLGIGALGLGLLAIIAYCAPHPASALTVLSVFQ